MRIRVHHDHLPRDEGRKRVTIDRMDTAHDNKVTDGPKKNQEVHPCVKENRWQYILWEAAKSGGGQGARGYQN